MPTISPLAITNTNSSSISVSLTSIAIHPELCTRIVTGPAYAKAFLKTLQDSIATFETTYGSISEEDVDNVAD